MSTNINSGDASLKSLLALSTAAQGSHETDESIKPMKDEDRKWLMEAMQHIVKETDPIRQMKDVMKELDEIENPSKNDFERVELLYEKLTNLVCDIDLALDFCKLDGLKLIDKYLKNEAEEIRGLFISLISIISQNNLEVQHRVFETDLLERFLDMIRDSSSSMKLKLKALGAISSIVRGHHGISKKFFELKGIDVLSDCFTRAFDANEEAVVNRLGIITTNIVISLRSHPTCKDMPELENLTTFLMGMHIKLKSKSERYREALDYIESALQKNHR